MTSIYFLSILFEILNIFSPFLSMVELCYYVKFLFSFSCRWLEQTTIILRKTTIDVIRISIQWCGDSSHFKDSIDFSVAQKPPPTPAAPNHVQPYMFLLRL